MSKYRIELNSSKWQKGLECGIFCLLVASVFLWQPNSIQYQAGWQVGCLLCIASVLLASRFRPKTTLPAAITLDEAGQVIWHASAQSMLPAQQYQVSSQSRVNSFLIWLVLTDGLPTKNMQTRYLLFRDQMSEPDFRRFCRVILRLQD